MQCPYCHKVVSELAISCPNCGHPIADYSPKNKVVAALLCFFLGVFGIHRFYVGKIITGILMIITFGGLGIWALIDFIIICFGGFKDSNGKLLKN